MHEDWALSSSTAVVVGGTRGIGRASANALAACGASVAVGGRARADGDAVAGAIAREYGTPAMGVEWDVRDPAASEAGVAAVQERFGRLDVCVVAAGINPYWSRAERVTPEMWDELMTVNLRGVFFAVQAAARPMLESGGGSIIVLSSVTASAGVARGLPYVASKGGLDAMVRSLAAEWADRGVRVNAVAPGFVETDLTSELQRNDQLRTELLRPIAMRRFGRPEEVGSVVAFLAGEAAGYMTGQVVFVDGGYQRVPA
jgi:NAD(P)-dependent dehydrogenase (short-subunit alcohol dehydrogenase family)